jgi:DNA-binding SARP family transcriptional activator
VFRPRVLRPVPSRFPLTQPALLSILDSPLTVVAAQTAFIVDTNVARVLRECGRFDRTAWLRLDSRDAVPDHLIRSLEDSVGQVGGREIQMLPALTRRVRRLSPEICWSVGSELAHHAPPDATIVVENSLAVSDAWALTNILAGWAGSCRDRRAVLLWHMRVPRRVRRVASLVLDADQLSIDTGLVRELVARDEGGLSASATAPLLRLARGRAALVHDVLDIAEHGRRPVAMEELLRSGACRPGFIGRLTKRLLSCCSPDEREALSLAMDLGYWHPSMDRGRPRDEEPTWPWFGPLEEGWLRLRPLWLRTLRRYVGAPPPRHRPLAGLTLGPLSSWHAQPMWMRRQGITDVVPAGLPVGPGSITRETPTGTPHVARRPAAPRANGGMREATAGASIMANGPPHHDSPAIELRLLGSFHAKIGSVEVTSWTGTKGREILQFLACRPDRSAARDALIEAFWPGIDPDTGRRRLHVTLHGLRCDLAAATDQSLIVWLDGAYHLAPGGEVWVDVLEFEALVARAFHLHRRGALTDAANLIIRARELYVGDLLENTVQPEWSVFRRENLRMLLLDSLDLLLGLYFRRSEHESTVDVAHDLLRLEPHREDVHRLLMRTYARLGQVQRAVRQYEMCRRRLRADLGLVPEPETSALHAAIRRGEQI